MKQISKKISKFLLLGSIFVILSCEVQEKYNESNTNQKIIVEDFSLRSILGKTNSKLLEVANKVKSLKTKASNSKIVYNADFDFYMEDEHGKHVVVNGKDSYTFEITRPTGDQKVENIIFNEKVDGSFDSYILKYGYTKDEFSTLSYDVLKDRELNYTQLDIQTNRWSPICIETFTFTTDDYYYSVDLSSGNGGVGGGTRVTIGMVCTNMGDSFDNGHYTGGNGNGNTGYNNNNSNPTGSNPQGGGNGVLTTPVVVANPCKKVKNQIEKFPSLSPALVSLAATTSQGNENGIFINNTATATTPNPVQNIPASLNTGGALELNPTPANPYVMIAHTHDAVGAGNGTLSIFSWADFHGFSRLIRFGHVDNDNFVLYLATADGTRYAMTINDATAFANFFNPMLDPATVLAGQSIMDEKQAEILKNLEKDFYGPDAGTIKPDSDPAADKIMFLKMLKEMGNLATLFEVDASFTTFTKLSLNSSGQPVSTPCSN